MDATPGDGRFDTYYRRIQLGLRLLSHGARAQTASEWSGLTPDRLVTLKRRWLPEAGDGFRGPAPTAFQPFFRSPRRASHGALFVSIHQILRHSSTHGAALQELEPSLENGELLCEAYEIFQEWAPDAAMEFDQAVLLARGAAKACDIELVLCRDCRRPSLIDKWTRRRKRCPVCRTRPDSR